MKLKQNELDLIIDSITFTIVHLKKINFLFQKKKEIKMLSQIKCKLIEEKKKHIDKNHNESFDVEIIEK